MNAVRQEPTASSEPSPLFLRRLLHLAPMFPGDLQRLVHRSLHLVMGGLEPEDQQRPTIAACEHLCLETVEEAAVGRMEARLGDLPNRDCTGEEVVEPHPAGELEAGALSDPHPGFGDDAEDALGAEQHPVWRGARTGAGKAPALPGPARCDRPDRGDEIVDVGLERGEVAAGTSRDPATQGRVLE